MRRSGLGALLASPVLVSACGSSTCMTDVGRRLGDAGPRGPRPAASLSTGLGDPRPSSFATGRIAVALVPSAAARVPVAGVEVGRGKGAVVAWGFHPEEGFAGESCVELSLGLARYPVVGEGGDIDVASLRLGFAADLARKGSLVFHGGFGTALEYVHAGDRPDYLTDALASLYALMPVPPSIYGRIGFALQKGGFLASLDAWASASAVRHYGGEAEPAEGLYAAGTALAVTWEW